MFALSVVTWNRRELLERVLRTVEETTRAEAESVGVKVLVTDNGSTDGTPDMLRQMEAAGKLRAWLLPENRGTAEGRNAHWAECLGHDAVRLDDKVLPLCAGWLTALKVQSDRYHAILAPPYDPTVRHIEVLAPAVDYVGWPQDMGRGGPLIYIPAEVTAALGGVDELDPEIRYGWDDVLQIERAMLLGWNFGFTLRVPVEFLASANPARRASAMKWHPLYLERLHQYREAERDVLIPMEETAGWRLTVKGKE